MTTIDDTSQLLHLNGRPVADAKTLARLSGKSLGSIYFAVGKGYISPIDSAVGGQLFDVEDWNNYASEVKVGRKGK